MKAVPLTYVLPLRTGAGEPVDELAADLRWLAGEVAEVLVVDGSSPEVVDAHRRAFPDEVAVVQPDERTPGTGACARPPRRLAP